MGMRTTVAIEDVNGSFKRFLDQAPKVARQYLSTAVFLTAGGIQKQMEANAPQGPDGEGLTPGTHIKAMVEHRGRNKGLHAQVGYFEPDDAAVALFNEYLPNKQPFMRPAASSESEPFKARAMRALEQCERDLSGSF
jgi:hypothetical protein